MSEPQVHTWFPKTVFVRDDVCLDQLDNFEKEVKSLGQTIVTEAFNVNSSHMVNNQLHKLDSMSSLTEAITENYSSYLQALGYCQPFIDDCFITDMWYNISGKDGYLFPHIHPGSLLSGVFYVKSCESNKIVFMNTLNSSLDTPQIKTQYNDQIAQYSCKPGRMLIFQSDLIHGTTKQVSPDEKIAISFNIRLSVV